jgi:hypothetical protein
MARLATVSARNHDDMRNQLSDELARRLKERGLVVAVLAHPRDPFAVAQLLPLVDYWHHRSSDFVDFVFLGYAAAESSSVDRVNAAKFSDTDFVLSLEHFERSGWRYSGRPSILIFDAVRKASTLEYDLGSVIECDLESAVRDDVIPSVAALFEWIIRLAHETSASVALWRMSDNIGARTFAFALGRLALKAVKFDDVRRALKPLDYFRVKNRS